MDQSTEIEPARIDELLGTYRELQAQFDRVLERVRRAESEQHTVPRRVYDRVRAEYDRELDSIRARMSPLRVEIDRLHEALESQCRDAHSVVQAVEEELAEVEFRHRVGEFADGAFDDRRRELDSKAEEVRAQHESLQNTLTTIATLRNPDARSRLKREKLTEVPAAPAPESVVARPSAIPVSETSVPEASAPEPPVVEPPVALPGETEVSLEDATPEVSTEERLYDVTPEASTEERLDDVTPEVSTEERLDDVTPEASTEERLDDVTPEIRAEEPETESNDEFENPHSWISDMGQDASRTERRVRLSVPKTAADAPPPAPPAPPKDELDSALAPLTAAANWPSLVFVSGSRAGQAIALLPTSLTIGREHDNNVEIKDPEVARYHARIQRNHDTYVVEDLNSSTGTWVNGERKERAVLTHGDVIRVGQTELAIDFEWTTDSR